MPSYVCDHYHEPTGSELVVMTQPVDPHIQIGDNVADLTEPYVSRTSYLIDGRQHWHTLTMPSLIDQLTTTTEPTTGAGNDGHNTPGSKPTARLQAIDLLADIRFKVRAELESVNIAVTKQLAVDLRHLVGAPWTPPQAKTVARLTGSWITAARYITDLEIPPKTPNGPCPVCDTRGTLRVRFDSWTAFCVECRAMWEPSTIGLLAEHIRAANGETSAA